LNVAIRNGAIVSRNVAKVCWVLKILQLKNVLTRLHVHDFFG